MKGKQKPFFSLITILIGIIMICSSPVYAADYTEDIISTVAGNGTNSYSGDDGPAVDAQISTIYGLAADSAGNIYIPDYNNNRVRKIDTSGNISTVAGTGTSGYSGDNGPATSADLCLPTALAVDSAGNIYIADRGNCRIRKVDAITGNISTVAGSGSSGYSGDDGPATIAQISSYVYGLAVDSSDNLYIADRGNYRIRKVDANGNISTVAGSGSSGYSGDNGPAVNAQISNVFQIACDSAGNLYFPDNNNNRIRKIDTSGNISTVAGNGTAGFDGDGVPATDTQINRPNGVAVDGAGNIYIADTNNNRIRKVDASGNISTIAGNGTAGFSGDDGLATEAQLKTPSSVAIDSTGNLYIADRSNYRIRLVKSIVPDPSIPGWPDKTLTVSNATATSLTLNWSPAIDDVAVTEYKIYQGTTLLTTDSITAISYTVSGLTENTSYTFTVQAVDEDGHESLYGPKITTATLDGTPPTWTEGSLTQSRLVADSVTLNWSGASDNQNKLAGYKVYQGTTLSTAEPVTGTTYIVSGLSAATEYTFTIQAVDTSGNESTDGPTLTVTTNVYDVTSPTWDSGSLTYTDLGPQSATLNWSGARDNIGGISYKVKLYNGTGTDNLVDEQIVTGNSGTFALTSSSANTIKVEALDSNENESTDGPQITITTPALNLGVDYPVYTGRPMTFEGGIIFEFGTQEISPGVTLRVDETPPDSISTPGLKVAGKFIFPKFTGLPTAREDQYLMRMTIPLVEGIDPTKVAIFQRSDNSNVYWLYKYPLDSFYISNPNFSEEEIAKGQEVVGNSIRSVLLAGGMRFGVYEDTEGPIVENCSMNLESITSSGVKFNFGCSDPSGTYRCLVYRDGTLINDYEFGSHRYLGPWTYTDTTAQPGNTYKYSIKLVDYFGNMSDAFPEVSASVPADDADTVALVKARGLFTFADGDSADSVTQYLKSLACPYKNFQVSWASSNTAIINPAVSLLTVNKPTDADSAEVTLTETITCGTATDTKVYNLTVRWTETAPVYNQTEFLTALDKSVVKNILLNSYIRASGTHDCKNKLVRANFSASNGYMFNTDDSLNLGNLTIDGNDKIFGMVIQAALSRSINFDNITFTGTDNFDYIIKAEDRSSTQEYEVVANNCSFSKTKSYAFFATTRSEYMGEVGRGKKITLTNNTFAEGADIRIEAGVATIMNNTINSRFIAYKGATLNGIAITDAATAETAVNALLASETGNQFTAPSDGSYGITVYDTDGTTVLYQTLKAATAAPSLTADSSDNFVNHPVELTFADDAAWTAAITGITVDSNPLDAGKYTVNANSITIAADVFTSAKDYAIVVKAAGYTDASVTQIVTNTPPASAPSLTADTSNNTAGQPIEIIFTDDAAWRAAITGITVDGNPLDAGKYTVAASSITIGANVFTSAKGYSVVVKATGYSDASVTQNIIASSSAEPKYSVIPLTNTAAYTIGSTNDGIQTMTVNNSVYESVYFAVTATPVWGHAGEETAVFVQLRNKAQIALKSVKTDFDGGANTAGVSFNVQIGDVIKTYIVDELTNEITRNPRVYQ